MLSWFVLFRLLLLAVIVAITLLLPLFRLFLEVVCISLWVLAMLSLVLTGCCLCYFAFYDVVSIVLLCWCRCC